MKTIPKRPADPPRKRWVHKRTLAIVFCLVVIPWILIAGPGTRSGGGGTTGLNVTTRWHGWPFVQLESTHANVYGDWVNGKFIYGQMPPGLDLDELVRNWVDDRPVDWELPSFQLDLRVGEKGKWLDEGFWSEASNWPSWKPGWHLKFRPWGLICNLMIVLLIAAIVAIPFEYKIRRSRKLLRVSLKEVFAATAIVAIALGWGVREHSRSAADEQLLKKLESLETAEDLMFGFEGKLRFSLLFSQLLDHGKFPWGASRLFRRYEEGNVRIMLDNWVSPKSIASLARTLSGSRFSVELDVIEYDETDEEILEELDNLKVESLSIEFDCYDWVYQKIGEENAALSWNAAKELAALKVDLKVKLLHLKELEIELSADLDQGDQLKPFCGLPALQTVEIRGLSETGAKYLLKTHTQWPSVMEVEFASEVSDELRTKLQQVFSLDTTAHE